MTQRTFNIIMACKGNIYPEEKTLVDRVKSYMSEECLYPKDKYTDNQIEGILFTAMCDYLDTCNKPSSFMLSMRNILSVKDPTFIDRVCIAFSLVQVQKKVNGKYEYVNGFKEEFYKDEDYIKMTNK